MRGGLKHNKSRKLFPLNYATSREAIARSARPTLFHKSIARRLTMLYRTRLTPGHSAIGSEEVPTLVIEPAVLKPPTYSTR